MYHTLSWAHSILTLSFHHRNLLLPC